MKIRLLVSVILCLVIFVNSFAQDECKDVLAVAYNKLKLDSRESYSSAAKSWFCGSSFFSDIRSHSQQGAVIIPEILEFGASGNSAAALEKRERFCRSSESSFSRDQAVAIFMQLVDERVIAAWQNCMLNKFRPTPTNISLEETVIGDDIFVTAKFNIIDDSSRDKRPLLLNYFVSGAREIKGNWLVGSEIPVHGILHQFRRLDEYGTVSVTVTTSLGISQTLVIHGKELPQQVGTIQASWEEPYQDEDSPQTVYSEMWTGNHHCTSNCEGEPTRTNYFLSLDGANWGPGYLRNVKLTCVEGTMNNGTSTCNAWNQVRRVELVNSKFAESSFDVWSYWSKWRLSGEWIPYVTKWRAKSYQLQKLNRGDQITLTIPKKARNVRIFGKTIEGAFDFGINTITSNQWLKYVGYDENTTNWTLKFKIPTRPQ